MGDLGNEEIVMIGARFAGLEGVVLLLPIIQTLLEVEPSQQQHNYHGKVVHAVSETLLAWMEGHGETQTGKPFCRHFKQQDLLLVPVSVSPGTGSCLPAGKTFGVSLRYHGTLTCRTLNYLIGDALHKLEGVRI